MNAETMRDPVATRLQEIEQRWHGDGVATRADISWLIKQARDLEYRKDFLENMYLERRTDHEERLVAEARVKNLRDALELMSRHAEEQDLLMPLHEQRQVSEALGLVRDNAEVDYRFFDKFGNPVEEEPSDPPEPVKPCSECGGWGVLTRHDEWWTCPLCRGSGKDEP